MLVRGVAGSKSLAHRTSDALRLRHRRRRARPADSFEMSKIEKKRKGAGRGGGRGEGGVHKREGKMRSAEPAKDPLYGFSR